MIEAKHLKKGSYFLHDGEPHRVQKVGIVVTGTHSHAKVKLESQGLFSGTNINQTLPLHDRVEEVEILRKAASVISMTPDTVQVMDARTFETLNAECDEEIKNNIAEGDEITYIEFNGKVMVIEKRQ